MKPEYWYKQSAVIPYRKRNGKIEILLITSRNKKRWIIPKGIIEPDLSAQKSAAKEAMEEAGVTGKVEKQIIATYKYKKWDGVCEVQVYAMPVKEISNDWEESFRRRKWIDLNNFKKYVKDKNLIKVLTKFKDKYLNNN